MRKDSQLRVSEDQNWKTHLNLEPQALPLKLRGTGRTGVTSGCCVMSGSHSWRSVFSALLPAGSICSTI